MNKRELRQLRDNVKSAAQRVVATMIDDDCSERTRRIAEDDWREWRNKLDGEILRLALERKKGK